MEVTKLVFGLGFNDRKYPASIGRVNTETYRVWSRMLHRCTNDCHIDHKSYIGTTCSDNFKNYSFFYRWCQTQVGFYDSTEKGRAWALDKDLLVKGNKLYSEDTCVFVPSSINNILCKRRGARGEYLIGVTWNKRVKRFVSRCNRGEGVIQYLGYFDNQEDAFQTYKVYKEGIIKKAAEEYKIKIDPRTYEALMKYEVSEND